MTQMARSFPDLEEIIARGLSLFDFDGNVTDPIALGLTEYYGDALYDYQNGYRFDSVQWFLDRLADLGYTDDNMPDVGWIGMDGD